MHLFLVITLLVQVLGPMVRAQQPALTQMEDKSTILAMVARARVSNGFAPLALNPALEKAAQQHSDDMARKGYVDHVGSDGSTAMERIRAAGYPAWSNTRVWGEVVYAGNKGFSEALDFVMKDDAQRRMLLDSHFREIGIGLAVAANAAGVQTTYWTLTFGSQPNVLPIFVNDGATLINAPQVAIHLTQEEAMPGGEGNTMGNALEVRISNDPSFKGVDWRRWEALIPFTFDSKPGPKTVYVQLRDGGGRTTVSAASVQYDPNSTPQVVPIGPGLQMPGGPLTDTVTDITPTPAVTLLPLQTAPVRSGRLVTPVVQVTAIVLTVAPISVQTPATPLPVAPAAHPGLLSERSDAGLPGWLLPAYLAIQALIIVLGLAGFYKMKR